MQVMRDASSTDHLVLLGLTVTAVTTWIFNVMYEDLMIIEL